MSCARKIGKSSAVICTVPSFYCKEGAEDDGGPRDASSGVESL
jgi:hypothetical protein